MVKPSQVVRALGRRARWLAGVAYPVDLNLICAVIHNGCMGLPQELVDHVVNMLQGDFRALVACSLTCKSMFVSTRPLIHETFRLTQQNNKSILTRQEKKELRQRSGHHELGFLSYAGERGLLRYARQVHILNPAIYNPENLLPHLHHFQSLNRVHTLTIDHYNAVKWENHYKTCFAHFYPTLTSLTLRHAYGHYRVVLRFALQFPSLENLCLEALQNRWGIPDPIAPRTPVEQSPPLRGLLRLVGYDTTLEWPEDLAQEFVNGINFRSVELESFSGDRVSHILQACARTLEELTIVLHDDGLYQLEGLPFTGTSVLRRLTLRILFLRISDLNQDVLRNALSTITSPVFCEFVLEIDRLRPDSWIPEYWGSWERTDEFLGEQFAEGRDFKLIIKTDELCERKAFQKGAEEQFPFLASKGRIRFETSNSV